MMPSSVAAACSSKLKLWQNFFLNAIPARLMRLPKGGAARAACRPIRRRSLERELIHVGTTPRLRFVRRGSGQSARPPGGTAVIVHQEVDRSVELAVLARLVRARQLESHRGAQLRHRDAHLVRPRGASPSQNGIDGGWPFASATRTTPLPMRRMRHECCRAGRHRPAGIRWRSPVSVPTK